jgi:hypothetical protein
MKTKILALLLFVLVAWFIPGCYVGSSNQDNGSGYNTDYPEYNVDDLNQYGEWVDINPYGRVWYPSVVSNWQPFTNGHWSWDGNDWVWVSYEPFGWIVYHYGSWDYSPDYGWFWIPGSEEWTPACVQWVDYGDYIGWAPQRHNGSWGEPWADNNVHHWMVVRKGDFNRENVNSYRVPTVTRVEDNNLNPILRRQPDVKTIQRYVKDPIGTVKITREPLVNQTPPERIVTPPVKNENPTVRTNTPPDRIVTPPERIVPPPLRNDNPPVWTNTPMVTKTQSNRHIVRMQVPPAEKQKVDRNSPRVQKEVLVKKNPRTQK